MKNVIAIFCALFLAPTFHSYAWIGGPFSNNTYFGSSGDDGVYEATATGPNAIGIYRITVANDFGGSQDIDTGQIIAPGFENLTIVNSSVNGFSIPTVSGVNSGNIFIGGFGFDEGPASNIWYYEGVAYFGRTTGTVNSLTGQVIGVGNAKLRGASRSSTTGPEINSAFNATLNGATELLPASAFSGTGTAGITNTTSDTSFEFDVIGSKVSSNIQFGK